MSIGGAMSVGSDGTLKTSTVKLSVFSPPASSRTRTVTGWSPTSSSEGVQEIRQLPLGVTTPGAEGHHQGAGCGELPPTLLQFRWVHRLGGVVPKYLTVGEDGVPGGGAHDHRLPVLAIAGEVAFSIRRHQVMDRSRDGLRHGGGPGPLALDPRPCEDQDERKDRLGGHGHLGSKA